MVTFELTLPDSLYERVQEAARRGGVTVEQFITAAVAEKLAADVFLNARGRRSTRPLFESAPAQVLDAPPRPGDEL